MKELRIGLLGFGTVSSGFYKGLNAVSPKWQTEQGWQVRVVKILVRPQEAQRHSAELQPLFTEDPKDILGNPEIDVVVEAISGAQPAAAYLEQALLAGQHVITANKAALASHWDSLLAAAKRGGCTLKYEASVCAGIPLIQVLQTLRQADEILGFEAIVNGTSNYILTAMQREGKNFHEALQEAQRLGFAEADPKADVEGIDAANKLSILCGLALNCHISPEAIPKAALSALTSAERGLRLVAEGKLEQGRVAAQVRLLTLDETHPLYGVDGVENGIVLYTKGLGQIRLYGPGAGADPTGTAVVSDLYQLCDKLLNQ